MSDQHQDQNKRGGLNVRAPQRFVAGIFFVCLCAFVLWAVRELDIGTIKFMGPAMFPRVLAIILGICGVVLIVLSLTRDAEGLETWHWRGPIVVTASILLFAVTIRDFGLTVAGFLALYVSGFATAEARPREVLIFAVAMTAGCVILFRYLLGMSVPVFSIPGTGVDF